VTRRFYDHFVRKSFSAGLREGLGLGKTGEPKIIRFRKTLVHHWCTTERPKRPKMENQLSDENAQNDIQVVENSVEAG